jgi:hypothetical protein
MPIPASRAILYHFPITTLFDKLQPPTRAEAIVRAREAGFGLQPE